MMEAKTERIEYDKDKIEGHKLEIRQILETLGVPSPFLNSLDDDEGECSSDSLLHDSRETPTTSVSENGES